VCVPGAVSSGPWVASHGGVAAARLGGPERATGECEAREERAAGLCVEGCPCGAITME
jgi:hypothetical protein